MIAPAGLTTTTQHLGGLPPSQLNPSTSAASVATPGTTLPMGTPIQKLSELSKKFELDATRHLRATDANLALLGQIGELSVDSKFQKTAWQLRQQLQRGDKVLHGEAHAKLSTALTEKSGAAPAFQSPGPVSDEHGVTSPKQALADALHQFKLESNDACFSRVQEAVRHAIPLLPDDFFAQCHEVIQVAGPLAACYLRAVDGGHVFQTDQEFDLRIRTSLFFPADPSQQPPANLSLVDRKRLMVLAYRANAALNLKRP